MKRKWRKNRTKNGADGLVCRLRIIKLPVMSRYWWKEVNLVGVSNWCYTSVGFSKKSRNFEIKLFTNFPLLMNYFVIIQDDITFILNISSLSNLFLCLNTDFLRILRKILWIKTASAHNLNKFACVNFSKKSLNLHCGNILQDRWKLDSSLKS